MTTTHTYTWCRWSVALAIIVSLLARTEVTSAKALGVQSGYWSGVDGIDKRNTWWSKKSLESSPEYQSSPSDTIYNRDSPSDLDIGQVSSLYDCYVQSCMPEFVSCAKSSQSSESYRRCKLLHRVCAASCYLGLPGAVLPVLETSD